MQFNHAKLLRRATLALTVVVVACSSDELTGPRELMAARGRWIQRGPTSYAFTIERSCECLDEMTGPVNVVVQNGSVISRKYARTGQTVSVTYAALFPSVDGLFDMLDSQIRAGNDLVVDFDRASGYPVRIGDKSGYTDPLIIFVRNLRPGN